MYLTTPNQGLVTVSGQTDGEEKALYAFVTQGLGPEALKYALNILDVYISTVGLHDQQKNVVATPRQMLLRMGISDSHVNEPDEQRKLLYMLLYLARSTVTVDESTWDDTALRRDGRRGRKVKNPQSHSPLIVLERVRTERDGTVVIPTEVQYHLGADTFELLAADGGLRFFPIPLDTVMHYHAKRQTGELWLAFHLCYHIHITKGPYEVYFPNLLLKSSLQSEEELQHGNQRLRDAARNVYALEQLQIDQLVVRAPHPDIDTLLAIDLQTKTITPEQLAPATFQRLCVEREGKISAEFRKIRNQYTEKELQDLRRRTIQNLLRRDDRAVILSFTAGPRIRVWKERLDQTRQDAQDGSTRAQIATIRQATDKATAKALETIEQATPDWLKQSGKQTP